MKKIRIQEGQSVYDIAIQYYGGIEGIFQIIQDNPGVDLEQLQPGMELLVSEIAIIERVYEYVSAPPVLPTKKEAVIEGQNIYDVAIQEYGGIEGVFQIIRDNPELTLDDDLQPGTKIKIDTTIASNKVMADYLKDRNIKVTTSAIGEVVSGSFWIDEMGNLVIDENGNKVTTE